MPPAAGPQTRTARIGPILWLPFSTVHRILVRHDLSRPAWIDRPTGQVIRRYGAHLSHSIWGRAAARTPAPVRRSGPYGKILPPRRRPDASPLRSGHVEPVFSHPDVGLKEWNQHMCGAGVGHHLFLPVQQVHYPALVEEAGQW